MRIVFIVILVILGILLVLPYKFGMDTEKKYQELIEAVSENQNITFVESSYERGWLSSKGKTLFSVNGNDGEVARIANEDTIYHGPVPIGLISKGEFQFKPVLGVIDSRAVIAPAPDSEYANIIRGFPPIIYKTLFNFDGSGTSEVNVPGIESLLENDDEIFSWSGLTLDIDFKPNFEDVNTKLNSSGMAINSRELEFSLKGLTGTSAIHYVGGDYSLPIGTVVLNIDSIDILNKEPESESGDFEMALKNLSFEGTNEEYAGALDFLHSLEFEELSIGELEYGKGGYKFALRNIDKTAWKKIQEILKKAGQNKEQENADIQNEELVEIMGVLPELVGKSPELEITDLLLQTGEGDLKGNLHIAINGDGLEDPEMALNPMFLLASISANSEISVTQTLLEDALLGFNVEEVQDEIKKGILTELSEEEVQNLAKERTKQNISDFTTENTLVLENGRYVFKAEYKTGQVIINGNAIGLDKLLGQ